MFFNKKVLAIALAAVVTACSNSNIPSEGTTQAQSADTLSFSSKAGNIDVPANLSRIAVLDTNALNTIHELGADEKVVALPKRYTFTSSIKQV